MKVSDTTFMSWSQDPSWDDFPHNLRFFKEDQAFAFNYSIYDNWGGNSWSYRGTFIDDGSTLTLTFTHRHYEEKLHALETPFTHTTPYVFIGNQVEFTVCVMSSFMRDVEKAPTHYYWKDFIEHGDLYSDDSE